jgi:hypothetical protein
MPQEARVRKGSRWPTREVLVGCYLLSLAGCGEGAGYLAGPIIASASANDSDSGSRHRNQRAGPDLGDPRQVQVQGARLRNTPGGCEVDVTYTNVSSKTLTAGFDVDVLDGAGRQVTSRGTAARQTAPGATSTVSSEGTTAGPSGVPCPAGGHARIADVFVLNL